MNLIIVGNGFDLFHGLQTRYIDFKHYLNSVKKTKLIDIIERFMPDTLWSDFENALGRVEITNIDIDDEEQVDEVDDRGIYIYDNYKNRLLIAVEELTDLFAKWARNIKIQGPAIFSSRFINEQNYFITFNYTRTLEIKYNILSKNILHIHGDANDPRSKIICGQCKQYDDREKIIDFEDINEDFDIEFDANSFILDEILHTYFKNTYKNTQEIIDQHSLFFSTLPYRDIQKVVILGHSFGIADAPYFYYLAKRVNPAAKWEATFYKEAERDLFHKFILSLSIPEQLISLKNMKEML